MILLGILGIITFVIIAAVLHGLLFGIDSNWATRGVLLVWLNVVYLLLYAHKPKVFPEFTTEITLSIAAMITIGLIPILLCIRKFMKEN